MAELFNKIAEEVQQATDELQSLITSAISATSEESNFDASGGSGSSADEFDMSDLDLDGMSEEEIQQMLAEEMMQNNPLQGIAEGVTQEIMAGQVCRFQTEDARWDLNRTFVHDDSTNNLMILKSFHL